jgi:hypothetical protein
MKRAPRAAKAPRKSRRRTASPRKARPRNAKGLVDAIFQKKDPVKVGAKLLGCKSDATAAKTYALFLEYRFGSPAKQIEAAAPGESRIVYQFVTHAPRPNYTGSAPDAVENRGGGPTGDASGSNEDQGTEDEND